MRHMSEGLHGHNYYVPAVTTLCKEGDHTAQEKPGEQWDTGKDELHTITLSANYPLAQPMASYLLIHGQQRPGDTEGTPRAFISMFGWGQEAGRAVLTSLRQ